VSLHSDDKYIQDTINNGANWSTAYFVAGDAFTCGSWIPNSELEKIANAAGDDARADKKATQPKIQGWMAALGALGGGVGGGYLGAGIQDGSVLGGLTGIKKQGDTDKEKCLKNYTAFENVIGSVDKAAFVSTYVNNLIDLTRDNLPDNDQDANKAITEARSALDGYNNSYLSYSSAKEDARKELGKKRAPLIIAVQTLRDQCVRVSDPDKNDDKKKGLSKGAAAGIGAAAGAVTGGLLTWGVTKSIQDAELDKAQQAAISEFMNNVGSKIRCYVGSEEVGMYGDVITTSME
jgi:hypothetical protein